jgi:hypothetical protein
MSPLPGVSKKTRAWANVPNQDENILKLKMEKKSYERERIT